MKLLNDFAISDYELFIGGKSVINSQHLESFFNISINNPIKVKIFNKFGHIEKVIVFIGNVPNEIQKELNTISNTFNKSNSIRQLKFSKKLTKYYGKDINSILGMTYNLDDKKGGDELEISLEDLSSIGILDTNITPIDTNITPIKNDKPNKVKPIKSEKTDNIIKKKKVETKYEIKFVFDLPNIYSYDNILEFKKKIFLVSGIPIYKQHIWYNNKNKSHSIKYYIYNNNKVIYSNITDIFQNSESSESNIDFIDEIPVLSEFYNIKDTLSIKSFDEFTTIGDIYQKTGITTYNLISFDEIIPKQKIVKLKSQNKNQIELIYYGLIILFWPMLTLSAFIDYINNSDNFAFIYPELNEKIVKLEKIYDLEKNITNEALDLFTNKSNATSLKNIGDNIYVSIIYSHIRVKSFLNDNTFNDETSGTNFLYIRNLFDKFELSEKIVACKCLLLINGKKIILNKVFKNNNVIKDTIPIKSIIFRLKLDPKKIEYIDLIIYKNGNYSIKSKWGENYMYGFTDILSICEKEINPIIKNINNMKSFVLIDSAIKLQELNKNNAIFSELNMNLIYRKHLSSNEFSIIKQILNDYVDANILNIKDLSNGDILEYYFTKGMYQYNTDIIEKNLVIDNYYKYLTDVDIKTRWELMFKQTRKTIIEYRYGDIKFNISGIKEQEFSTFYLYIVNIFNLLEKNRFKIKSLQSEASEKNYSKKSIKNLKNQDPMLYNFKKLYNSPIVYSKICQKPFQPVILSKKDYEKLSKKNKDNVINYWNFTTQKDALYYCPNPKYPYIKFIVNKHPKNYCIPCCKKTSTDINDNIIKKNIYEACLNSHIYDKKKGNLITDTRYIMSYGKYIDPGRISNLPEDNLEPLFYESFSEQNVGIENECLASNRYFLYGLEQNYLGIKMNGYLNALVICLEKTPIEIHNILLKEINAKKNTFRILLNGNIIKYFRDIDQLLDSLYEIFHYSEKDELYSQNMNKIPWNKIFIELAYYYLKINTIMFKDVQNTIKLHIPSTLNNVNDLFDESVRHMIVVNKNNIINPIFYLNNITYFKSGLIEQKLFNPDDNIINIISKVLDYNLKNKIVELNKSILNLNSYIQFIKDKTYKKIYSITSYFINKNNFCYYIELYNIKYKEYIYIPVNFSSYTYNKEIELIFKPFNRKTYTNKFKHINTFINDFNNWTTFQSSKNSTIYNPITVEKWLYLDNLYQTNYNSNKSKVIGFVYNNINYYHEDITYQMAKQLKNTKFMRILYDPDIINQHIYNDSKISVDNRVKNITKNMYDYNLYELLLLEYINLFNKDRNISIRHSIKKKIMTSKQNILLSEVINILKDYYKIDSDNIGGKSKQNDTDETNINKREDDLNDIIKLPSITLEENMFEEDAIKLMEQINNYIISYDDKKKLLEQIDNTFYNFDKIVLNNLKQLSKKEIKQELLKLSKKIVTISSESLKLSKSKKSSNAINAQNFPNMLISCQYSKTNIFCKKNKLLITKNKLDELLDIMVGDILNPIKEKWLFNFIFTDQVINYFKFIRRKNEHITILVE